MSYFDNFVWREALMSSSVALCREIMGDLINDYKSFNGHPYLVPDSTKVEKMRRRLNHFSEPLVGICWCGSLVDYNRANYMFLLDEIMDIFQVKGIQFVNLKYLTFDWELEKIEDRYPGKLVHFSDIDQYNDFETTAALMKCMDLVITPCNTVFELAGALGCPTLMFSNSAANSWRRNPLRSGRDVCHNTVEMVEGDPIGDKASLLSILITKLEKWKLDYYQLREDRVNA